MLLFHELVNLALTHLLKVLLYPGGFQPPTDQALARLLAYALDFNLYSVV